MPVGAEGRVEHQKRTQTATTLWPFGFVFGVQLGLLEKKKTRRGPVRAALDHLKDLHQAEVHVQKTVAEFAFPKGIAMSI